MIIKNLLILFLLTFSGCFVSTDLQQNVPMKKFVKFSNTSIEVLAEDGMIEHEEITQEFLNTIRDSLEDNLGTTQRDSEHILNIKVVIYSYEAPSTVDGLILASIGNIGALVQFYDENNILLNEIEIDFETQYNYSTILFPREQSQLVDKITKYSKKYFLTKNEN